MSACKLVYIVRSRSRECARAHMMSRRRGRRDPRTPACACTASATTSTTTTRSPSAWHARKENLSTGLVGDAACSLGRWLERMDGLLVVRDKRRATRRPGLPRFRRHYFIFSGVTTQKIENSRVQKWVHSHDLYLPLA
jgi:hypothetical protein